MRKAILPVSIALLCVVTSWTCAFGLPPVQRTVLDNGLVLLVSEEHSLPFVTINLMVKTGAKDDPPFGEGLANLTASSLLLGAAGRTLKQINEELDFMGADMNASANKDYTTVSLRVLKKDLERAFSIFMDVVTKPTFPADEVRKEISRTLAAIQSLEDRPGRVADRAFEKALYMGGPYGHPTEGTVESVSKLSREEIKRFHDRHYCPDNAILSVVGDIDQRSVDGYVALLLRKWPKGGTPVKTVEIKFSTRKEMIKINKPVTQSNIVIGNGGISRDNPDYYAAVVMNHILGAGSLTSRLMEDIRNKKGLAYSVASIFEGRKYPGPFMIFLQTKNRSTTEAIKATMENLERVRSELVSEKELEDAKKYLVGNFPQRFNTQSRIASFFAQVEYYGLGLDYPEKYPSLINGVTREDVLRVARAYVHPDEVITVVVADLKEAGLE
jgi:zinc protease